MSNFRRAAAVALVALGLVSCSDRTAPTGTTLASPSASRDLLGTLIGVNGVQRTKPLADSITVSAVIGGDGGTLAIPAAGVTVVVPRGALIAPVTITMTARAGSLIAYDFAPHGIVFAKPLRFTQSLQGTNASVLGTTSMQLGYYTDASLLSSTGGLVSELLGGTVDLLRWSFSAPIPHFSGYMVACGRE